MNSIEWQRRALQTDDLEIAWYEAGEGPVTVFLHGGPGHDHRLIRSLAEPMLPRYRCILPDQRGSGQSHLPVINDQALHIDRLVADIEALRQELGQEQMQLVGWSWGAALGLLYNLAHPQRVERLAMISPGPIPYEMVEVYQANMLRPLSKHERGLIAGLLEQGEAARQAENQAKYNALYQERMAVMFRVWFYDPQLAAQQLQPFLDCVEPYRMATIEQHVLGSLGQFRHWANFNAITNPVLIVYGYQDFEPITQAYTLREWMPQTEIAMINRCGHWPWLEQPEEFYKVIETFIQA